MTAAPPEACGCCTGTSPRTPGVLGNRPGLPELSYRSGTHGDFLDSMLTALSNATRPQLAMLRTRDTDDPTIALLDAWAVVCDVLTFYNERLANESYLRTATQRRSLQELGRLIAYRLRPGVAAETWLAFSLERPPAPVPHPPTDPGLKPLAVPSAVTLPIGLRVQSTPGPGELPQTFETVEDIQARPEWSSLPVVQTRAYPPVFGRSDIWLAAVERGPLNVRPGEVVLLAGDDLSHDRWDVRLATAVTVERSPEGDDHVHVEFDKALGSDQPYNLPADQAKAFLLRKRVPVFGHNAPVWKAMNEEFRKGYASLHTGASFDDDEWPSFVTVTAASGGRVVVDLDGSHPDVVVNSWVVVSQEGTGFYRELYKVVDRAELSRAEFGVSGTVTRLTLEGEAHSFGTPRQVTVLAVAEAVDIIEAPDPDDVATAEIIVEGDAADMEKGRTLFLVGRDPGGGVLSETLTLDTATAAGAGRTRLHFTTAPASPYVRTGAVVLGNVAKATHGETVHEILGDGDARQAFQRFKLTHAPLTYVQSDTPAGASSTLRVSVDDVTWQEVPTLFTAAPNDRVYTTTVADDVSVQFGDAKRGARPASGSHNLRAKYRTGLGVAGNVDRDRISQLLDRPLGVKGATNPSAAGGGADPEPDAHARATMPRPVRTLGRAVSRHDYVDFALAFAGIALADVAVLSVSGGRTVVVTVTGQDGRPASDATVQHLTAALRQYGDPYVRVTVLPHRAASFRAAASVAVDPDRQQDDVLAVVDAALHSTYAPLARQLGQPVHQSEIIATVARVPGVVAVTCDRLYRTDASPSVADRLLAGQAGVDAAGQPLAAELLALADGPLDWLQVMS